MKIMTLNVRNSLANDGENAWEHRREILFEYLRHARADVLCMQEVTPAVKREMCERLGEWYEFAGEGRLAESKPEDEINLVGYRKGVYSQTARAHFWLSDTPDEPASRYPAQSKWPRTCTCVKLRSAEREFAVFATHLDNLDAASREKGMQLVLGRAREEKAAFVCGDFNDAPENVHAWTGEAYRDLTVGLCDTYNGYGKESSKIDYILTNAPVALRYAACDCVLRDGVYISDHFPVYVQFDWKEA